MPQRILADLFFLLNLCGFFVQDCTFIRISLCTNQRPIKIYRSQFLQTHLLPTDIFVHSKSGLMRFTSMFMNERTKDRKKKKFIAFGSHTESVIAALLPPPPPSLSSTPSPNEKLWQITLSHNTHAHTHTFKNLLISVVVIIFLSFCFASFHFASSGRCLCAFDTFFASTLNVMVCVAQCARFGSAQCHA